MGEEIIPGKERGMRFAQHLSSHLTPEWRKHYIDYEVIRIRKKTLCMARGYVGYAVPCAFLCPGFKKESLPYGR